MSDEEGLLQSMLAEPNNVHLWLMVADWLEERGDPRGELVRLAHELTRAVRVRKRDEKESRLQALLARRVQPVVPVLTNSIGMKLALVPPGTFLMGSPRSEPKRSTREGKRQPVEISQAFLLGVYPVTQREYKMVMGRNPAYFNDRKGGGPQHPVENVSWKDALAFCRQLSKRPEEKHARRVYRLPTEAEWEYACRAGTSSPFHYGTSLSSKQANFEGKNYPYGGAPKGRYLRRTSKVGSYIPNAFGLYDMHGNVSEWCEDELPIPDRDYTFDRCKDRVIRGGSWYDAGLNCRSASRDSFPVVDGDYVHGFRVVCVAHEQVKKRALGERGKGTSTGSADAAAITAVRLQRRSGPPRR
jgi:uncharacterized protein (TIGR02996 family)